MRNRYKTRDITQQDEVGGYYTKNIEAITNEKLQSNSDIAAELAHRDITIITLFLLLDRIVNDEYFEAFDLEDIQADDVALWLKRYFEKNKPLQAAMLKC